MRKRWILVPFRPLPHFCFRFLLKCSYLTHLFVSDPPANAEAVEPRDRFRFRIPGFDLWLLDSMKNFLLSFLTREYLEVGFFFLVSWLAILFLYIVSDFVALMPSYAFPIAGFLIIFTLCLNPLPIFYFSGRKWTILNIVRDENCRIDSLWIETV